jgi:hypothetical protein
MNRRTFLKTASRTAAGLVFMSGKLCAVAAQGNSDSEMDDLEKYDFIMPRVKFPHLVKPGYGEAPDKWNVRPGGDKYLLDRLSAVVRCNTKPITNIISGWNPSLGAESQFNAVVTFDNPGKINRYPFLFMTDENEFQFNQTQKNNLKEYILRGGFLFMDDCVVDHGGDFFYQSAYRMLEEVFGRNSVKSIPREHEVFHNVYDLGGVGLPYVQGLDHGAKGVFIVERLAIFLSSNDIHCGWCDAAMTEFVPPKHELAIQMGINIIMYAISH